MSDIGGKFSIIIISSNSCYFFLFLLVVLLHLCYTFCSYTAVLGYSVSSPPSHLFFSQLFSFGDFCWDILKLRDSPLSHVQSTNKPIKSILHYPYSVLDLYYLFWFFLRTSIFLLTLLICPCMLSILSIRTLSILVIVVLNSCFVISAFLPYLRLVLMLCFFKLCFVLFCFVAICYAL